jgi:predicted nuclease of predicted toxin-antitoxin system
MKIRLLANENFPMPSVATLRDAGHDVLAIAETQRGMTDREVLSPAISEDRWLVTFDRDYGDLIFAKDLPSPPALVLFRLRSYRPDDPGRILLDVLTESSRLSGQFVVVEEENLRMRPLPTRSGGMDPT